MNMQTIQNGSDLVLLYQPLSLYLKPTANLSISITLPANVTGKAISNFEVMDKLRQMILPDSFSLLKVSKTTIDFLRFDGELDDRNKLKHVILRLDGRQIKLTGFTEYVKVRAVECKSDFPTRHDWDSFFRDAKNMDEMKAGERPDTVYISNLPIRWVCPRHHENDDMVKPSESLFKRIFEKFGEVRSVDIPICDPYRDQMKGGLTGLKNLSFEDETYFEGYVQFTEYGSFVRCMDEFRGMKLVRKDSDKMVAVNILVHFDKTKHLSDASIKRRKVIREHLMEKDRQKAAEEEKKLAAEREKLEKIKAKEEVRRQIQQKRQQEREERRKQKNIQKITETESSELTKKIRKEQKKLLKAQRKMESIRLLEALFSRIEKKFPIDDVNGPTKGFKGFDLRKKLKKKKSKKDSKKDDDSISMSSVSSDESSKKKNKKRRDSSASSSSSSSSNDSRDRRHKPPIKTNPMTNGMFPTTGWIPTETGEWLPAPYMYAAPFFPNMMAPRPYFNPNYRGGFRGRGRGRGRYYDGRYGGRYDDYREHDYRRSRSRSRSRSPRRRSYSRSRSRSRRSRRRRSYTRSSSRSRSRSKSHSRSRSKSRHRSKSKSKHRSRSKSRHHSKPKLVSTLRDSDINKPAPPTIRKSRSASGSGGWSSDDGNHKRSKKSRRDWSRSTSPLIPLKEARAIRKAAEDKVTKEMAEQLKVDEERLKQKERELEEEAAEIERRMEQEANGHIQLYSPDRNEGHTPPIREKSKDKSVEKSPEKSPPTNVSTEPVNEIYTTEEIASLS